MFTWQTRLFRKSKVLYKGLLHEQPLVSGALEKLEEPYYMEHRNELRTKSAAEYTQIERFDRLSYSMLNKRMLEYLGKVSVEGSSKAGNSFSGRAVLSALLFYECLSSKKPGQELSDLDYRLYSYIKNFGYILTLHNIRVIPRLRSGVDAYVKYKRKLKDSPNGAKEFEISKIVNEVGITKFLSLDKERTILQLNKTYKRKRQGIDLLIKLLIKRYDEVSSRGK